MMVKTEMKEKSSETNIFRLRKMSTFQ